MILKWVREVALFDELYKKRRCVHGHWQAGALSFGARFKYNNESWPERDIPPLLDLLRETAQNITGIPYNVVLLKVYVNAEDSLGRHQDVDGERVLANYLFITNLKHPTCLFSNKGSPQNVACFTFASNPRALRNLQWFRGKSGARVIAQVCPEAGSMWHFGGDINARYSHRVQSVASSNEQSSIDEEGALNGIRVSVTCRRVSWSDEDMSCL